MSNKTQSEELAEAGVGIHKIVDAVCAGAATRAVVVLAAALFHQRDVGYVPPDRVLTTAKSWMAFVADTKE